MSAPTFKPATLPAEPSQLSLLKFAPKHGYPTLMWTHQMKIPVSTKTSNFTALPACHFKLTQMRKISYAKSWIRLASWA